MEIIESRVWIARLLDLGELLASDSDAAIAAELFENPQGEIARQTNVLLATRRQGPPQGNDEKIETLLLDLAILARDLVEHSLLSQELNRAQ